MYQTFEMQQAAEKKQARKIAITGAVEDFLAMASLLRSKRFIALLTKPQATRFGRQDALWNSLVKSWTNKATWSCPRDARDAPVNVLATMTADVLTDTAGALIERLGLSIKAASRRFSVPKGTDPVVAMAQRFNAQAISDNTVELTRSERQETYGIRTFEAREIANETALFLSSIQTLTSDTGLTAYESVLAKLFAEADPTYWLSHPRDILVHDKATIQMNQDGEVQWAIRRDFASSHMTNDGTSAVPSCSDPASYIVLTVNKGCIGSSGVKGIRLLPKAA